METQYKHAFDYETPKASRFVRGLWQISGGDKTLLQRATFSDQVKYACLGGVILATGGMAALSGGYAFFTIFSTGENENNIPLYVYAIAVFFGLIWGLIIFNIDRFIVTSTGKGDGTEKITMDEFKSSIPRIILGLIIAITVSKPLEIRMFKPEISVELENMNKEKLDKSLVGINKKYEDLKNAQLGKSKDLVAKIDAYNKQLDFLQKQYIEECRIVKPGPRALAIKAEMDRVTTLNDGLKNGDYKKVQAILDDLERQRVGELTNQEKMIRANVGGLSDRIRALEDVAPITSWMVTLLFVAVELTPIFFKLMLIKTPYDYLAENRDDLIRAENGIEIVYDIEDDEKGGIKENHHTINHDAELAIFTKNKLTEVKKYLTSYALVKYTEDKKKEIDQNPDKFIS